MEGPVYRSESMFAQEEPEDFSWHRAARIDKNKGRKHHKCVKAQSIQRMCENKQQINFIERLVASVLNVLSESIMCASRKTR